MGARRVAAGRVVAGRVVSVLFFFPRGGSAQVARALGRALPAQGWQVRLVAGSLGRGGDQTHAETFFTGTEVRPVDYSRAARLDDSPTTGLPFQPSYEDRPGAADRVFAAVGDLAYERLVDAWAAALAEAGAEQADVLHLHHLTPVNAAAARVCPDVPVVGQLHGTELAMLRTIAAGPPASWTYASAWAGRMRRRAQRCTRLLVPPALVGEASSLLGVPRADIVALPGGVDSKRFDRRPLVGRGAVRLLAPRPRRAGPWAGTRAAVPARSPTRARSSGRFAQAARSFSTPGASRR